jgi:hypothetical protein
MPMFALFRDGEFAEVRNLPERPDDIEHKAIEWFPVGDAVTTQTQGDAGWAIIAGEAIQTIYVAPPSTDPNDYRLEPFQFFAMLEIMGEAMDPVRDLKAEIETAIDAIEDTTQRAVARAKYQHVTLFHRDNPLFAQLAPSLGLTDAQIDAAWMQAKDIA